MGDGHVDSTLDIIGKASLKPFQRLRCLKELVVQRRLYVVATSLGVIQQAERLDREHVRRGQIMSYICPDHFRIFTSGSLLARAAGV